MSSIVFFVRDEYPEFTLGVEPKQRPCDIMSFDYDTLGDELHEGHSIRVATQWGPMIAPSMQALNEFHRGYDDALVRKHAFIDVVIRFQDIYVDGQWVREIPTEVQLVCKQFFDITLVRDWQTPMNPPLPLEFNEYLQDEQKRIHPGWDAADLLF